MPDARIRAELPAIFRQITLTIGSVFAAYNADDQLIWAVTRELGQIFSAHLDPEITEPSGALRPRPHPAVIELLASLDQRAARPSAHRPGQASGSADL